MCVNGTTELGPGNVCDWPGATTSRSMYVPGTTLVNEQRIVAGHLGVVAIRRAFIEPVELGATERELAIAVVADRLNRGPPGILRPPIRRVDLIKSILVRKQDLACWQDEHHI